MIHIAIKHVIYNQCIDVLFNALFSNFIKPKLDEYYKIVFDINGKSIPMQIDWDTKYHLESVHNVNVDDLLRDRAQFIIDHDAMLNRMNNEGYPVPFPESPKNRDDELKDAGWNVG